MKIFKKLTYAVAAVLSAAIAGAAGAAAADGDITYYDVSAYINNSPIPCYCANDLCAIYVKDLCAYGFSVDYNEGERVVTIARDAGQTEISGIDGVKLPFQKSRTLYKTSEATKNRVLINGEEVPSYCVDGSMMIIFDELGRFGDVVWDADRRAIFASIDGLSHTEYAPLEKAKRVYTRYKPPVYELDKQHYTQFSTNEIDWGFKRVEGGAPILSDQWKALLAKYDAYYIDPEMPHKIYLTFDEGYENGYTPQILDVLSKYNVPATFFVTGSYIDSRPDLVQDMIDRGFSVGNHTDRHPNLAKASVSNVMSELDSVSNKLRDDFGYTCVYMRPPEGAISERVLAIAKDMGYNTILWSFAYYDYEPSVQKGTDYAYDMITRYMHNGAVYLLHAVSKDNANALESVIQYALENGYEFGSLDDLCQP